MEFDYLKVPSANDSLSTINDFAQELQSWLNTYNIDQKITQILFGITYHDKITQFNNPTFKNYLNSQNIVASNNYACQRGTSLVSLLNTIFSGPNHTSINTLQCIYYGAPGTGKSHMAKEDTKGYIVHRTTFHPDTDYASFVGSYKPIPGNGVIDYKFVPQVFVNAYLDAWVNYLQNSISAPTSTSSQVSNVQPNNSSILNYCLLIDEINRGNCAQIFGDLFQLLDRKDGFSEYSLIADKDLADYIIDFFNAKGINIQDYYNAIRDHSDIADDGQHLIPAWDPSTLGNNKIRLCLPPNLSIVATMNTSDQSLYPMDSAFKRRWEWKYVPITEGVNNNHQSLSWVIQVGNVYYDWWDCIKKINVEIADETSSEDKQLGYFFCKADNNGIISVETFVNKVLFYLYNDVFRAYGLDRDIFTDKKDSNDPKLSFTKYYDESGNIVINKVEQFINNLGVETSDNVQPVVHSTVSTSSKYTVNGTLCTSHINMVRKVFEIYLTNNPGETDLQIVNDWDQSIKISQGFKLSHFIETTTQYNARTDVSKTRTSELATDPSSRGLYISTQYGNNITDFVKAINATTGWGINITIL